MSVWTHVNCSIRIDAVRINDSGKSKITELKKKLGKIIEWEDLSTVPDNPIPNGTEGSLRYQIIKNTDRASLAAYLIIIWGDLRDYNDHNEVLQYFKSVIEGEMIRSLVFEIDVEGSSKIHGYYDDEKGFCLI